MRNFYISKTKTDVSDTYLIAQVIRIDSPDETPFIEEDLLELRHLERLRYSFVDQCSDIKRKVISLLDQVFPEYEQLFSDGFGKSSTEILPHSPLPEDILKVDTEKLSALLIHERYEKSNSLEKANQIRESALNTFAISIDQMYLNYKFIFY